MRQNCWLRWRSTPRRILGGASIEAQRSDAAAFLVSGLITPPAESTFQRGRWAFAFNNGAPLAPAYEGFYSAFYSAFDSATVAPYVAPYVRASARTSVRASVCASVPASVTASASATRSPAAWGEHFRCCEARFSCLLLNLSQDFFSMHAHMPRCRDTEPHLIPSHGNNRHDDIVPDRNRLICTPGQNQHRHLRLLPSLPASPCADSTWRLGGPTSLFGLRPMIPVTKPAQCPTGRRPLVVGLCAAHCGGIEAIPLLSGAHSAMYVRRWRVRLI